MADTGVKQLNLLLVWHAGRLSVALSDGRGLGRVASTAVADSRLHSLAAEAEPARRGTLDDRRLVGLAMLQQLIPEEIAAALGASDARVLHLQLGPPLIALPWEWAFEAVANPSQPWSVYRHLLQDAPASSPRTDTGRRHHQHLRLMVAYRSASDADTPTYVQHLERQISGMGDVTARFLATGAEEGEAPLMRQIGDCDVLHVLGDVTQLLDLRQGQVRASGGAALVLDLVALLDAPPRLLIVEDAMPPALASRHLHDQLALASKAAVAGMSLLFWQARADDMQRSEAMAGFYATLAQGKTLGDALALLSQLESTADAVRYVDPAALLAPEAALRHPDDHTRQITVLCYDLVDSTGLLRKLGAERYSETLDRFHGSCAEVLGRWGGQANPPQGNDGVMCFFGLPIAHEDAPAMALRAALAMSDAVAQLGLQVRIGIVTGPVVVRAGLPLGEPIHLAARLAALAAAGGIMVSESTRAIVRERFRFSAPAEPATLKGFGPDEPAFVLIGVHADDSETARAAKETPWVGRQAELRRLEVAWAQAGEGRLTGLLVLGEAGIGKTRLVREFRRGLRGQTHQVIDLRCNPEDAGSAFRSLIDMLVRWFLLNGGEPRHELEQKMDIRLQGFPNRQHIIAGLVPMLDQQVAAIETAAPKVPEKVRQQFIEALLLWTDTLTLRGPLCLIIEDHNWLDPSTSELLQRLKADFAQRPLLLVLTERSEPGRHAERPDGLDVLVLEGLGIHDTEILLRRICGDTALPDALIDNLVAKTDGVPLFIEESALALLARLRQSPHRPGDASTELPQLMPGKVQDLLMARLDRLNAAKVVAQYASSIGRHFSQALIQAVCTHESAPIRVDGVLFHLESLVRAGILGQSNLGQGVQYHFRHALMQDAAYESLWERDRQRCHSTVARVITERFPGLAASQPEVLARHCSAAGLAEPAIQYWENAARLAISRAAQEEASQHVAAALALIESLPASTARDRTELRLLLLQAGQGIALRGYGAEQVGTAYRRAEALSRQCGDNRALLRVQFGLEGYLFMRGEFKRAHEVADGATELLKTVADPMRRVQAQWAVANLVFHEGQLAQAVRRMDACLADYGRLEQRSGQMQDPAVMSLSYSALAQWSLGFADDALARAEQAQALATRLKHPLSLGEAHGLKAMLHCYRRDYLDTLECAQRAIHVCESSGFAVWLAHARIMHGWAVAHLGNPKAGLAEMAAGYAQWTSTGAVVTCAFYLGVQAEALALAGEPVQGLALLDQALAIATGCGERYFEAELCRLQGELLLHHKNDSKEANQDKAQDWFLRSIKVAQELGLSAFEARAAQSLATLWQSQGRLAEAQALLTSANKVSMIS